MANADSSKQIALGADHGGYELKEHLKRWLADRGWAIDDCGTFGGETADYPKIAATVAQRVSDGRCWRGIIIDGAGIGSSMAANKFPGVRAALCYDISSARNSREHNDANVLTLGARLIGRDLAEQIVEVWLSTECVEDRHRRRVAMIGELEHGGGGTGLAVVESGEREAVQGAGGARVSAASLFPSGAAAELAELSSEDLDRIASRIAEMVGDTGLRGPGKAPDADAARGFIGMGAGRFANGLGSGPVARDVARYIDHTLLRPEATAREIEQLCNEALENGFASVCVNPSFVKLAAKLLKGSSVAVCTVVGFPLGAHVPEIKAMEARRAIREGAREVDMVINIGALKGGDDESLYRDVKAVVDACMDGRALCKVIIECALLTDDEKVRACRIAKRAGADFVKTSTGFSTGGATAADVALMSEAVRGTGMGVKAAGGIRSFEEMKKMVQAGATRIGASVGVKIVKEAKGATESN
ncbi:MAG: deoxyribose-phosphate aldolase [Phycisphaerae bacterium]|nr:deoxyribose-phosphate aldolase [Phycisphaerae bacterium]